MLKRHRFQSPPELVEILKETLTDRFARKGEALYVEEMHGVREFWSWLDPIGITLHNAFVSREHIVAPHAYSYKLMRSLAPSEKKQLVQLGGRGATAGDDDVFCVYKVWMHSTSTKGPILVLPVGRRDLVETSAPQTVSLRDPPTHADVTNLNKLADLLEPRTVLVGERFKLDFEVRIKCSGGVQGPWQAAVGLNCREGRGD